LWKVVFIMEIRTLISQVSKSTAVRHVVVDAALGVACGALYGMVFGGFKSIGAKDFYSVTFGAIALGAIGGIAVAVCGLCFGSASVQKTENRVLPTR
jgi:hypothetical protein